MRSIKLQWVLSGLILWQVVAVGQVPQAYIWSGEDEVCLGDSVAADLTIKDGTAPWTVVINDSQGEYITLKEINSPYVVWLKPDTDDIYTIARVVDALGVEGETFGEVDIRVLPILPVEIILDRTTYLKSEPGISLVSDPDGAEFSGNGVIGNLFYPSVATPAGSPHEISCIYTNLNGCSSSDHIDLEVIHGESEVALYSGEEPVVSVCDTAIGYEIRGSNQDHQAGLFSIRAIDGTEPLPGTLVDEDAGDNLAIFNASGLSGIYEIEYTYQYDVLTVTDTVEIVVHDLESLTIKGLPDTVCSEDDLYHLLPGGIDDDPEAIYTFSGTGVSGNQADGFWFDPGVVGGLPDLVTVVMDYTTADGCQRRIEAQTGVYFTPAASFTFSPTCLPPEGGTVTFNNTTTGKYAVDHWLWDFGDPAGGSSNNSDLENPQYSYDAPGQPVITLTAITGAGCISTSIQDTVLADQPVADMMWFHDCFVRGGAISFMDRSESHLEQIDSLVWTFKTGSGSVIGSTSSNSPADTIVFGFPTRDNYQVQLEVWNQGGCHDLTTKEIVLKPVIAVTTDGYSAHFDDDNTMWIADSENQVSSWDRGTPGFTGFDPVAENMAWFTDLPYGDDDYLESSWVESPCFDLTQTDHPLIALDLMKSFRPGLDGAVLQYLVGEGEDWETLGGVGEGVNWYDVSGIANSPGGGDFGWGGGQEAPDSLWKQAGYDVGMLAATSHTKFRIVVATGSETESGNQGFAFDNFRITEPARSSLLEHFTNSSQASSKIADDMVDAYVRENRPHVLDLQYHTDLPGADPMNANNAYPPSVRSFFYGVPGAPYAILNGREAPEYRVNFSDLTEMPDERLLLQSAIEQQHFEMELEVAWEEQRLEAVATISCLDETYPANVQLYMAVVESEVTAYVGGNQDVEFRNVVLDMLPTPTGELLGSDWKQGDVVTKSLSWDYAGFIEDIEDLAVVAFIQDRDRGVVLQVSAAYKDTLVGIGKPGNLARELTVYPNPAMDLLFVNLGERSTGIGSLVITDLSGRGIMEVEIQPGYAIIRLETGSLPQGIYMVSWVESGLLKGQNKLIILR
ncbi:MAG: T9SS type A sorting domain-containing protein [Bacteroidota bacterium]